jgi:phosphoglycolate phosphatase
VSHDAIVYDLDGTLVRLAVNWKTVDTEAARILADAGVETEAEPIWDLLDVADRAGVRDAVETMLAAHEVRGAERSLRLPAADDLADDARPIGVCSLNAERACHTALDVHDLAQYVDTVIGRDSVATRKPDPEPLRAAARELGVPVENVLFVGDSDSDAVTADRAGADFAYVDGAQN